MGAAAAIEREKPVDASDILRTGDLNFAKAEVIRLRRDLGHLAADYGVEILSMDASDLIFGEDSEADFQRCIEYVSHIRKCLQLNTQKSRRQNRRQYHQWQDEELDLKEAEGKDSDSSSDEES
jgi:hypothetical protein